MAEAWYDPDEMKAMADGAQTQPEFAAEDDVYDYTDIEGEIDGLDEFVKRMNEIKAIVDAI